ncbi:MULTISPECIES: glycosyltransferase family 4 protein [unclassified Agrococcus]|uniref:glycosyltransferase family 4 protein n=1 Tax=unclassified Agrococcus TaxID=2615065 RepID=UPI00361CF794
MPTAPPIRVAAVPAGHPYVRAVTPDDGSAVVLADPVVDAAHPERWWPPAVLDADWIRANADALDLVHVHFGMESLPAGRLEGALDALDALGIPLVFTVHDLDNPQLTDQAAHRRDIDALVPRATRLVTLTEAAARRIRDAYGRDAAVLPHPTLLDGAAPPSAHDAKVPTIGIHLRDLRPSIDALGAARGLAATLDALAADGLRAEGRVLVNDTTRDPRTADEVEALLRDRADCIVVRRPRPDDDALVAEVDELDVAWLPYAHGTHSGWVELCFDRGVQVVGPAALPMADQHPGEYHGVDDARSAAGATRAALEAATRAGSAARIAQVEGRLQRRRLERKATRAAHAALYRAVMHECDRSNESAG